ncbi:MAG: hypothetical protein HQL99_12890 [Magnetococcales bacterium]|nr:hypothetical protein [Magnetococcales bacterium]
MSKYLDVTIGGIAYRIPRGYVSSISYKSKGVVKHVSIDLSYPDMEPITKMSVSERNAPGFGRQIGLLVQTYDRTPRLDAILNNMHNAGMASRSGIDYSMDGIQKLPAIKPMWDNEDRYVLIRNSLLAMILSCNRSKPGTNPGCHFYADFGHNFGIQGSFGRKFLEEVEFVNGALIKLFDSFKVESSKTVQSNTSTLSRDGESYV